MKKTTTEKEVLKVLKDRWIKGRQTYGQGISFDQGNTAEHWLDNAIEEAADMLQYLVAFKMMIKKGKNGKNKA